MTLKFLRKRLLPAFLFVLFGSCFAHAQTAKVVGDWEGVFGDGRHILMHFTAETPTLLSGTIDSPDQGATDIPLSDISFKDGVLSASVAMVQGIYKATLSADGNTLTGTWSQDGGEPTPMIFTRIVTAPAAPVSAPAQPTSPPQ